MFAESKSADEQIVKKVWDRLDADNKYMRLMEFHCGPSFYGYDSLNIPCEELEVFYKMDWSKIVQILNL